MTPWSLAWRKKTISVHCLRYNFSQGGKSQEKAAQGQLFCFSSADSSLQKSLNSRASSCKSCTLLKTTMSRFDFGSDTDTNQYKYAFTAISKVCHIAEITSELLFRRKFCLCAYRQWRRGLHFISNGDRLPHSVECQAS